MLSSAVQRFPLSAVRRVALCASLALLLAGCGRKDETASTGTSSTPADTATTPPPVTAMADLTPTQGNTVDGVVVFTEVPEGVHVVADLTGLTPGQHGIHLHMVGDCSAPDGSSAGDHFNPMSMAHGSPDVPVHHEGDLGNIEAASDGAGHLDRVIPNAHLQGTDGLIGHSVVVHAKPDDMKTQPSGASGARQACGVIVIQPKSDTSVTVSRGRRQPSARPRESRSPRDPPGGPIPPHDTMF